MLANVRVTMRVAMVMLVVMIMIVVVLGAHGVCLPI
jgi:hypothetical protein